MVNGFRKRETVKLTISERNVILIQVAVALSITILTVFLFLDLKDLTSVSDDAAIREYYRLKMILKYLSEISLSIIFMIFVLFGRHRVSYGNLFAVLWLSLWVILTVMPFAILNSNYVELGILSIPTVIIYIALFSHMSEVRTEAKIRKLESDRMDQL